MLVFGLTPIYLREKCRLESCPHGFIFRKEIVTKIEQYIKKSREEIEGAIWDDDPLDIFWMLEELQAENEKLKKDLYGKINSQRNEIGNLCAENEKLRIDKQALKAVNNERN